MDLRPLDETTSVAPMLEPSDMAAMAREGITTVICNRPDAEVPPSHRAAAMQSAAEAVGLAFVFNPVAGAALTLQAVEEQADAIDGAEGSVVAYCGCRSMRFWRRRRGPDINLTVCGRRSRHWRPSNDRREQTGRQALA